MTIRQVSAQAIRYGLVGLALNGLYWLFAVGIERWSPWGQTAASGLSYAVTSTLAYVLHRRITFQSRSPMGPEVRRFALATCAGMALALCLPYILPGPSALAYAAVCVVTPLVNFLVYSVLVYDQPSDT